MIENLSPNSETGQYISNGLAELVKISSNRIPRSKDSDYESQYISDSFAGTIVSTEGNVIHSGAGVLGGNIRNVLFYTYTNHIRKGKYNPDVQYTKLNVLCAIIQDLWKNRDIRLDLLKLMYYCFDTTNITYQTTCAGCFTDFIGFYKLLIHLNTLDAVKRSNETNILEILKGFCNDDDFMKKNSRNERAKKRSNILEL